MMGNGSWGRRESDASGTRRRADVATLSGQLPQHVRDAGRGDGSVEPALQGCEVGARVDARVVVLARRELPAREHPAQGGTRLGKPTLQPTFRQRLVDELLLLLGAGFQEEVEDALPASLDLGILDRAEPSEELLLR